MFKTSVFVALFVLGYAKPRPQGEVDSLDTNSGGEIPAPVELMCPVCWFDNENKAFFNADKELVQNAMSGTEDNNECVKACPAPNICLVRLDSLEELEGSKEVEIEQNTEAEDKWIKYECGPESKLCNRNSNSSCNTHIIKLENYETPAPPTTKVKTAAPTVDFGTTVDGAIETKATTGGQDNVAVENGDAGYDIVRKTSGSNGAQTTAVYGFGPTCPSCFPFPGIKRKEPEDCKKDTQASSSCGAKDNLDDPNADPSSCYKLTNSGDDTAYFECLSMSEINLVCQFENSVPCTFVMYNNDATASAGSPTTGIEHATTPDNKVKTAPPDTNPTHPPKKEPEPEPVIPTADKPDKPEPTKPEPEKPTPDKTKVKTEEPIPDTDKEQIKNSVDDSTEGETEAGETDNNIVDEGKFEEVSNKDKSGASCLISSTFVFFGIVLLQM